MTPPRVPVTVIDDQGARPGVLTSDDHGDLIQFAICTNDQGCTAPADGHDDTCPVEHQLRKEFGY